MDYLYRKLGVLVNEFENDVFLSSLNFVFWVLNYLLVNQVS